MSSTQQDIERAQSLEQQGQWEEAARLYRRAAKVLDENRKAQLQLIQRAILCQGRVTYGTGRA